MRERGYKDVTDPEELKRKLSQWQARQLVLQGRKSKIESLIREIDKKLKRTTTYTENIGRALALYKTYNGSWYTRSRDFTNLVFLREFVPPAEGSPSPDREERYTSEPPSKGNCIHFYAREVQSGTILTFKDIEVQVAQPEIVSVRCRRDDERGYPVWKELRYYICQKTQEALRNIGTIVPDLELLTVFGNRQLPKLLEKLVAIKEEEWPLSADRYGDPQSLQKRFFVHPETGRWCQIVVMEE